MIDNLFLSVGAMKAGTSWLFKQLEDHPDIISTPVKEIHYFAHVNTNIKLLDNNARLGALNEYFKWINGNSNLKELSKNLRWFAAYLDDPVDDRWFFNLFGERNAQKYCAEYSNLLCILDDTAWDHVLDVAKNVKVVYTLRDPLKRLWSHTRFHHAVNRISGDLSSWNEEKFCHYFESEGLLSQGYYAENILRMRRHLSDEQLMLCFFEKFRIDPEQELRRIEKFLHVSHKQYKKVDLETVHNPSPPMPMPEPFIEAARMYVMAEFEKLDVLGLKVPGSWRIP